MRNKKQKVINLLKKAKKELELYKKYQRFTNLSQACEKTWVAFTILMEYKSGKESKSGKTTRTIAQELGYGELYHQSKNLHIIHYEGYPTMSEHDVISDVQETINNIKKQL